MLKPLTARQEKILLWIHKQWRVDGRPPTVREIATAFGIRSTNGANDHLKALEAKGWIERDAMVSRGIRVLFIPHGALP